MARFDKLELDTGDAGRPDDDRPVEHVDADHWLRRADEQWRTGYFENALRYYSRALEEDHSRVEGWVGQVRMLVQLGEMPEAETWSRKALENFAQHAELLAGRAQALCRLNRVKEAYAAIDGAMQQPGQSAFRWLVRGELLLVGNQTTYRHCFDKAVQTEPDWIVPLECGRVCRHYRKPSVAHGYLRTAVEREPSSWFAWLELGRSQHESGLDLQARRSFERVLELSPGNVDAEREIAQLHRPASLWRRIKSLWTR